MNGKKGPSFISKATFLHTTHSHIHDDIYIYAGKKIPKSICLEKKVSPFYFVVWFSNNQMYFLFSQKDYDNQSCIHTFIKDLLSIAAVEVNYLSLLQNASQHSSNQKSHFLDSLQTIDHQRQYTADMKNTFGFQVAAGSGFAFRVLLTAYFAIKT